MNEEFSPTSAVVAEEDIKPEVEEKLSEIQRRKNIVENSKFLDEMGLNSAASILAPPKPVREYRTKKDNLVLLPERSSGRLVNARLKDDYVEPNYKPPRNLKEFYTTKSKSENDDESNQGRFKHSILFSFEWRQNSLYLAYSENQSFQFYCFVSSCC